VGKIVNKRHLIGLLWLGVLLVFCCFPLWGEEAWNFIVLGDCRPACFGAPIPPIYSKMLEEFNLIYPDLVCFTGDSVLIGNDPKQSRAGFENFLKANRKLQVPLYTVPGNHDYNNAVNIKLYHQLVNPRPYYSINHKDAHFIFLNTEIPGEVASIQGKQLEWLRKDLAKTAKNQVIFVFMHRAMFSALNPNFSPLLKDNFCNKTNRDLLAALFSRYKVRAVFCAHEHLLDQKIVDGVLYVITGGAGAPLYRSPQHGGIYHYMLVEMRDGKASVTPHLPEDLFWNRSGKGMEITYIGNSPMPLGGIPLPTGINGNAVKIKSVHYPGSQPSFCVWQKAGKIYLKTYISPNDVLKINWRGR